MEFFAEDMAAAEPTESELAAYLAANSERFATEPEVSFHQVFLSSSRGGSIHADAARMAEALGQPSANSNALGDGFLLGSEFKAKRKGEISRDFGASFADKLIAPPLESWQGPFRSPFGLHSVFVTERRDGGLPSLAEVRKAVEREWANARRIEKLEEHYRALRDRYELIIESPVAASPAPADTAIVQT